MKNVTGLITANYRIDGMGVLAGERGIASIPYGGRYRLIDFPLSNMINAGIHSVGLITPPKYRSVIDHIGTGSNWMLDRKRGGLYILPGSSYGNATKGARFMLRDMIENKVFLTRSNSEYVLVSGTNVIYNMDFNPLVDAHIESGADITMVSKKAVRDNSFLLKLDTKGRRVTGISHGVKKGETSFIDIFIISKEILLQYMDWYEAHDYLDLFDVLARDLDRVNAQVYKYDGYSRGIDTVRDYFEASMDLLDPATSDAIFKPAAPVRTKVQDCVPAKIYGKAEVSNSLISSGCVVHGKVENSILFRGVIVEEGAVIKNSIVMQSCVIRKGASINHAIVDRNNELVDGIKIEGKAADPFVIEKAARPVKKL